MGRRRAHLWALFQRCNPKAKAKTRKDLASAHVLEAERPEDDINNKLEYEIANKDSRHRQTEDKNRQLQERLELVEKLQQRLQRAETLPEVEAEQAQRVASLSKVLLWRHSSIEDRLCQMEAQLEEKNKELQRGLLENIFSELQCWELIPTDVTCSAHFGASHFTSRKQAVQAVSFAVSYDQLILNLETLRAEVDQMRLQDRHGVFGGTSQRNCRPHLGSAPDLRFPVADRPADSLGNGAVLWCPQKGRLAALHDEPSEARTPPPPSSALNVADETWSSRAQVQTPKEQDCERTQQASMLADVAQAFESDEGVSDDEGDRVTLFSLATQLSPSRQANAKTLTVMMQEQLDVINEEIRLIEEEKENTEQWAEETESREGRGSLGSLRRFKSVSSLNLLPTSWHAGSCPPLPKPRRRRPSLAQEGDQLGIMTLLPAIREEVGDDKTSIKCETSTLAWPRSLQLGRLHTGALRTATHEDLRDAHNSTGSQDSPGNNPSSSSSSQGSLHKAPKKKGIKSSISRLFRKKEKGRPEHPSKETLGPEK
ncbi:hypothetical protein E5288_WYG021817 [Bos mutus]|uniref:Liprin-alpha CC2 domain-containing protein n=1 Tax=Bos mutus TaxID=72004 RepID=A0A6B0RXY6_9CETA|nr:hypothetical protein [Bos mutus]